MKCSTENIDKLYQTLLGQMEDESGRGEFDEESDLLTACETVIGWLEEGEVEVEQYQPTIYIQPRAGITELSKKFVEEHLPKIGTVSGVFCYINDRLDYITSIAGSEGGIIVDGLSWGYAGEGPHGLLWLLRDKFGVNITITDIASLGKPHTWKICPVIESEK